MNIVVVGAGAIGSLFGGFLSKKNTVVLVGRLPHIKAIQHDGLSIKGKTRLHMKITAVDSIKDIHITPDLILLTVKSYDTVTAIKQIAPFLCNDTIVLSIQNGLDNIEKIEQVIERNHILVGVTTHGTIYSSPGIIIHTGKGKTILGELDGLYSKRLEKIIHVFDDAGIETCASNDIKKEIWGKAIINSSINPLTTFLKCRNGYLLENPLLENIVNYICEESTRVAQSEGMHLTPAEMIQRTKEVIMETAKNYSSMLQSVQQGKKTEIDSINGLLVSLGKNHGIPTPLNEILNILVHSLSKTLQNSL
jgi:2-dehydropantoate 2-reductase